jgi:tRNA(Ile)-lysidine synthase
MAHLISKWSSVHHPTLDIRAFVVDHKLRTQSTEEATYVANFLEKSMHIPSTILTMHWERPPTQKQLEARVKRHDLLYRACKEHGIHLLILAHHADDMIETLFYRMAFQTGVLGLSAISGVRQEHEDYWILRPFLNFTKERLLRTLVDAKIKWIEDPSNQEESDFRSIIRSGLPRIYAKGVKKEELLQLIQHFKKQREYITKYLADFFHTNVHFDHNFGMARIPTFRLAKLEDDVIAKILYVIIGYLRNVEDNREEKIMEAAKKIRKAKIHCRITVCGCFFWKDQDSLYVCREIQEISTVALGYGEKILWDNRFEIEVEQYDKWTFQTSKDIESHMKSLETNYFRLMGQNFEDSLFVNTRIPDFKGKVDTNPASILTIRILNRREWEMFLHNRENKVLMQSIQEPVRTSLFAIIDEEGLLAIPQVGYKRKANIFVDFKFVSKNSDITLTLNRD